MKKPKNRKIIPAIRGAISNASHSVQRAVPATRNILSSPRRRAFVAAATVSGAAFGGGALGWGLGELNQDYQMEIRNVTAAQYDREQARDIAIGTVFYGAVGTAFGLVLAPCVRTREELKADRADKAARHERQNRTQNAQEGPGLHFPEAA